MGRTIFIAIISAGLAAACGAQPASDLESEAPVGLAASVPPARPVADEMQRVSTAGYTGAVDAPIAVSHAGRHLIRTVDLALRVGASEERADEIRVLVDEAGGFVSGLSASRVEGAVQYHMTLRVPAERLDRIVAQLKGLAEVVEHESVGTQDVTDAVVDVEARLATLAATERELRGLLADSRTRGQGVSDIMAVYRELTGIRGQIESAEAHRRSLAERTELATIQLSLLPTSAARPVSVARWRPVEIARDSVRVLVRLAQAGGTVLIRLLIIGLPILLLLAVPVWAVRRGWPRATRAGA